LPLIGSVLDREVDRRMDLFKPWICISSLLLLRLLLLSNGCEKTPLRGLQP